MRASGSNRYAARNYPSGATEIRQLNTDQQRLLLARHSPCQGTSQSANGNAKDDEEFHTPEVECSCRGFRPPNSVKVKPISVKSDANDDGTQWGWEQCKCGHSLDSHGLTAQQGHDEFTRRAKVALRIDELLGDKRKLLDFDYEDEDTRSLKK
jgi:histone acetyltransferase